MQPSVSRLAVSSSLLYFGAFGLVMAGGLISMPILTRVLTKEEYGLLSLVIAWVTVFAAAGRLGFPQATTRFLAEKRAEGQPALRRFCDVMFTGSLAGAVVASLLGFAVSGWLGAMPGFQAAMRIGCLVVFTRVVGSVVFEIYRAAEHRRAFASGQVLTRVLSLALSIVFLFAFEYSAAAVLLGTAVGELAVTVAFTWPLFSGGTLSRLDWSSPLVTHATRYGLPLAVANAGSVMLQYGDRVLIERFLGLEAVATYAVSYDLAASLPMAVFNPVQLAVLPIVFRLWADEGEQATSAFLSRVLTHTVALAFPIGAIYLLVNGDLIVLFASSKYADAASLTPFLLLGVLVDQLTFVTGSGIRLAQRTAVAAVITLAGALLNVVLNLVLLPLVGLRGAAIATTVAYVVIFAATSAYATRIVSFHIGWALVLKSLLVSVVAYLAAALLLPHFSSPMIAVLLRGGFAAGVFSLAILTVDDALRGALVANLRRLWRVLPARSEAA